MKSYALPEAEIMIDQIMRYLNAESGRKFGVRTKRSRDLVEILYLLGYNNEHIKRVIDLKVRQWGRDEKKKKNLRPQTLFGTAHFREYLFEATQSLNH